MCVLCDWVVVTKFDVPSDVLLMTIEVTVSATDVVELITIIELVAEGKAVEVVDPANNSAVAEAENETVELELVEPPLVLELSAKVELAIKTSVLENDVFCEVAAATDSVVELEAIEELRLETPVLDIGSKVELAVSTPVLETTADSEVDEPAIELVVGAVDDTVATLALEEVEEIATSIVDEVAARLGLVLAARPKVVGFLAALEVVLRAELTVDEVAITLEVESEMRTDFVVEELTTVVDIVSMLGYAVVDCHVIELAAELEFEIALGLAIAASVVDELTNVLGLETTLELGVTEA